MSTFLRSKKATGGRQRLLLAKGALPLGCVINQQCRLRWHALSIVKVGVCFWFDCIFPLLDQIKPIGRLVPVN